MVIKVYSLMRSGHHAIMEWVYQHLPPSRSFINNCKKNRGYTYTIIDNMERIKRKGLKKAINCENILLNFEHLNLNKDFNWTFNHLNLKSDINIIILRDPYNWLASSLSFRQNIKTNMGLWKIYAKEFIGETNKISNKICISYNEWVISEKYREDKIKEMGLCYKKIDRIKGHSSSFKNKDYLNRWKKYKNKKNYLKKVNNEEIFYYSKKIFNFNPINFNK